MHIPDGYLSLSTCGVMYGASVSFWYVSLKKLKQTLATRAIPLVSVFASFCFLLMMLNIPLPGGTTGHATGIAIAAIVLGPWSSVLAISLALAIQALLFGDGGITTLGANCFNMAVVGSFVAYGTYRAVAFGSEMSSKRRLIAAAVAGYVSINAAALATAFEFGVQPILFHDSTGAPAYAPYPLHIAIPAVMIGHLTVAGLAEAAVSAGMFSFLQRADVSLLRPVAHTRSDRQGASLLFARVLTRRGLIAIAILLVLTPLGVLATGTAWGEWSTDALTTTAGRNEVAGASGGHAPPQQLPTGLQRLSGVWSAPFPDYAPRFIKSTALGYFLSAMFGIGIVLLTSLAATHLVKKQDSSGEERS